MDYRSLRLVAVVASCGWAALATAQENSSRESIMTGYERVVERLRAAVEHEMEARQLPALSIALVDRSTGYRSTVDGTLLRC
jgi:hypothetical protein